MRSDWGKSGTDSAQRKILTGCVASVCGIWASLYYVFPLHKGAGTALAMLGPRRHLSDTLAATEKEKRSACLRKPPPAAQTTQPSAKQ